MLPSFHGFRWAGGKGGWPFHQILWRKLLHSAFALLEQADNGENTAVASTDRAVLSSSVAPSFG